MGLRFIAIALSLLVFSHRGHSAISEEQFNGVLDRLYAIYAPMAEARNSNLVFYRNFFVDEVNSFAARRGPGGSDWIIEVSGGSARHPLMTEDAFALNVCHELGHHFGGRPFFEMPSMRWGSIEGQADYFATLSCMKKYLANENNVAAMKSVAVPSIVSEMCQRNFISDNAVAICKRSAMAGLALGKFDASNLLLSAPSFSASFSYVVRRTYPLHPPLQCRLITYLAGAVCPRGQDHWHDLGPVPCTRNLGDLDGVRPRCWFKP